MRGGGGVPLRRGLQELTLKALHILRKLVEMENQKEDDKTSVLEWNTMGDEPEVGHGRCPVSVNSAAQ